LRKVTYAENGETGASAVLHAEEDIASNLGIVVNQMVAYLKILEENPATNNLVKKYAVNGQRGENVQSLVVEVRKADGGLAMEI